MSFAVAQEIRRWRLLVRRSVNIVEHAILISINVRGFHKMIMII